MADGPQYLTVAGVAELLGLHPESVREMARTGRLPGFKAGRSWRFDRADLEAWRREQREAPAPAPESPSPVPHVLIVDDEAWVCQVLERIVRRFGCRASSSTSAATALELIAGEAPDVILLDLVMPGLNGPSFLARLRRTHPALPVVIVTGFPDSELMTQAMQHPPVLLLAKPVEANLVERTVRSVLGQAAPRARST